MTKIIPILKWAGGKRQLLSTLLPIFPEKYNRYYEPFVGAGAVLFSLEPQRAVINDSNVELINVYNVIKKSPKELIDKLREHEKKHSKEHYYKVRNVDRSEETFSKWGEIDRAARTIYLNRTCYNGLYRVNKKGYFNTPIGHNSHIQIVNENGIYAISDYLRQNDIKICNGDYHNALKYMRNDDFVFFDPPYYPINKDYFVRYDSTQFGPSDQEELKRVCDTLSEQGIKFVETNSDCDEIRILYKEYHLIETQVRRCINSKVDGRKAKELIITNF